jgi:glycosyltransferase involved in cell wall biosynthesis
MRRYWNVSDPLEMTVVTLQALIIILFSRNMLQYPAREYVTQVARFDPSKGIPDVIESYRKLREMLEEKAPGMVTPQLLVYEIPAFPGFVKE